MTPPSSRTLPGPHRCLRDGPRLHRPADQGIQLPLQQAGAPFETIENALPFLKTPEKQALLKKVDDALTAMRKDGSLRQISEKWFASDITDK